MLGRFKDSVLRFVDGEQSVQDKKNAAEGLGDYCEFGEAVVSSIPGHQYVQEFLSLGQQLARSCAKRM